MSAGRLEAAVVIPAHDGLPDVLDAVASALAQSHPPAEVIVVDDRSGDGTGDAVERRFGDARDAAGRPRVRVLRGAYGGAAAARNAGWRAAGAPWIAFLDADDLWFPDKLAVAEATLAAVPGAGWFFSDGAFRTLDGTLHASWLSSYADLPERYAGHPLAALLEVNFVLTSSVIVRRERLAALGGFDESLSHAEDVDLWIRLARTVPAAAARRALVRYQHRPGGLTRQLESRLSSSATLFGRLAGDASLAPDLRRRARARAALAHYKLAFAALREGRGAEARAHLGGALDRPARWPAVALVFLASLLPGGAIARLRRSDFAKRRVAGPALALRRVRLETEPGLIAPVAPGEPGRASGGGAT